MGWFKKFIKSFETNAANAGKSVKKLEKQLDNGLHDDLKHILHVIEVNATNAVKEGRKLEHGLEVSAKDGIKFGGKGLKWLAEHMPPVLLAKFLIKQGKDLAQLIHDNVDSFRKHRSADKAAAALELLAAHEKEVELENAIAKEMARKVNKNAYYAIGGIIILLVLVIIIKKLK